MKIMMQTAGLLLLVVLLLAGCQQQLPGPDENPVGDTGNITDNSGNNQPDNQAILAGSGLRKFNSSKEIIDYLQEAQASSSDMYHGGYAMRNMAVEDMAVDSMAVPSVAGKGESVAQASAPAGSTGDGADEFSATNVQVEGVDEADIVKNDGKYIYMVNQNNLVIVDAYPADSAKVVYEEEMKATPRDLFVNGDRMAVFTQDNDQVYTIQPYDFMPRPRYVQKTHVIIYDISDRSDPEVMDNYDITGSYFQSRMIGDYVYLIVKDSVYYYSNYVDLPAIRESGSVVSSPEIYYFDNPEDSYVFHTIASFNIKDPGEINSKSFLMGYSDNLYVSQDNIYITYQKNLPWRYQETQREDRFFDAVVPQLPDDVQKKIKAVKGSSSESYEKWMKISQIMQDMYDSMSDSQQESLVEDIYDSVSDYDARMEAEQRKTVIHKINIDKGKITYDTSGEVSGYLLNQFSMDEKDGDLRVATTTYTYSSKKSQMHNNVYVLDDDLDVIGKLENIAPDESIYSTRFIGDRLYMVTFKRIDPLFVIDLSNPKNPKILGELKIPGYSDYLHPYDEDHIIGIGKETGANDWGGTSIKGVKLALFDVSDVNNPKVVDSYEIGTSGTDSEALRDHKAFLFDKEKNILVLPIREVKEQRIYDSLYGYYRDRVWQGAYVFGLTPEDGFELKGKISHMSGLERYDYYYYSGNAVRRALYMDDVLYTVSGKKILANDINNIDDELNEVDLPYDSDKTWWY